jgi:Fe-S cluster biosynthesis and repair protein YggX
MSRRVQCKVLGREAEGLTYAPYPGELGVRIYREISQEGWQKWVDHQTMLINEYRLTPIDPKHRQFLVEEMQKFLFGEGAARPEGYVPPRG